MIRWHAHASKAIRGFAMGVPHELEEYPGGHGGHHWRFESRLITMLRKMGLPARHR